MSAQLLRDAATKMRAKAERAATIRDATTGESLAWSASPHGDVYGLGGDWICDTASASFAEHVASWHPAVAHAVANWLDNEARSWAGDEDHGDCGHTDCTYVAAVATARAYLSAPVSAGEPAQEARDEQ